MYKTPSQLKSEVKDSLRGRWKEAVFLNLIPSLLQIALFFLVAVGIAAAIFFISLFATSMSTSSESSSGYSISSESGFSDSDFEDFFDNIEDDSSYTNSSFMPSVNANFSSTFLSPILSLVMAFITVGISFTFLDVIRKKDEQTMAFKDAFRVFNGVDFVPVFLINLLVYVFSYLWSLLFVIPGIVKGYSYSQSNFIYKDLSTHTDVRSMGATSFISESRILMKGHKGRLFWLDLTFIGWYILSMFTFGIALLWVNPYVTATKAAFYNDLAKDRYLVPQNDQEEEDEWTSF